MHELQIPKEVADDPEARELLRAWTTGEHQAFSIQLPDAWSDPAAWGLLLVDLARHAARAYSQIHGGDLETILSRIKAGLDAEWEAPTDASEDSGKN